MKISRLIKEWLADESQGRRLLTFLEEKTGGLSLLAVGLSRKENHTQARCMNCGSTWVF